jgi:hypothetical protein
MLFNIHLKDKSKNRQKIKNTSFKELKTQNVLIIMTHQNFQVGDFEKKRSRRKWVSLNSETLIASVGLVQTLDDAGVFI